MSNQNDTQPQEPPFTLNLSFPIAVSSNGRIADPITSVTVQRRPRLKDLKAIAQAGGGELVQSAVAIERLTNMPKAAIDELDVRDFEMLSEALSPFFEPAEAPAKADATAAIS